MKTNNFGNIRKQAKEFNSTKNYAKAIELYSELFEKEKNLQDSTEYIFCLLQNHNYDKSLEVSRIVYAENQKNKRISAMYAQAIYYSQIKIENPDKNIFLKAATAITKLVTADEPYSPYQNTILKTLDFIKKHYPENAILRLEWTNKIKIEQLNTEPFIFTKQNSEKKIKIASSLEKWALHKANALKDLHEFNNLLNFTNEILNIETIKKSTYKIWLLRIKAIALINTGKPEQAENIYNEIILQKKDWFIIYEFAKILQQNNKEKKALDKLLTIDIINTPTFAAIKILNLIKDFLKDSDKRNLNEKIIFHIENIKKQSTTNDNTKLLRQYYTHKKDLENLTGNTANNNVKKTGTEQTGIIIKILEGNKAGFIKTENNGNIYFEVKEYKGALREIIEGLKVKFKTAETFDKKKQQKSTKAVEIYKINS
jgi:tetratricopeptide (TPR) repeat protein